MQDGKILLALLEILSGHRLMHHYKQSTHRIFRLNNIAKALNFLEDGYVKLVSIDAPEVADGNPSMILGLIWNIILHFQIKEAAGHLKIFSPTISQSSLHCKSENDLSLPSLSPMETAPMVSKDQRKVIKALLKWVQRRTAKYGVAVHDFGSSWRNGVAFLALIKAIKPSLVDMKEAMERPSWVNLEDAFQIAENSLAIPPLLEPEDVDVERPEEQSIATYVSQFLEHFPDADENDLPEDTPELPLENTCFNTVAAPSDLDVEDSCKTEGQGVINDSLAPQHPKELAHTALKEDLVDDRNLHGEDDRSFAIEDGRESISSSSIPVLKGPVTSVHQDGGSPPLVRRSTPDDTETVEEIFVLLHPVRRKSSRGEKMLVLEKELTSPDSSDYGSANDVFTAVPDIKTAQAPAKELWESSSEKEAACSPCNSQGQSLHPVDLRTDAAAPAQGRTVSESSMQTDNKTAPQPSGTDSTISDEGKVSVIPLKLVYYPHYDVPVSDVLEAFSVADPSQREFISRIHSDKELSPLTDEAYQSCSELSGALSLQELSPTLCTPDFDQADGVNPSSPPELAQPLHPSQGTETSKLVPCAPNGCPETCSDGLPEWPVQEGANRCWEERSSLPKSGRVPVPEREHRDERSEGPEEGGDQLWHLHSDPVRGGGELIGGDVEHCGSDLVLAVDASEWKETVTQGTVISRSSISGTTEDVRAANGGHMRRTDQELAPEVMDEPHLSHWEHCVNNQDHVFTWSEPREFIQDEWFEDADLPTSVGIQEGQHKVPDGQLLLNEPTEQMSFQRSIYYKSDLQSYNPNKLTLGFRGASIDERDEISLGSTAHPHLPYLVILLWMGVYWMFILLHVDLESLGQFTSS
ncbi:calmin-like isoform X2 [Narcine bancroftii]